MEDSGSGGRVMRHCAGIRYKRDEIVGQGRNQARLDLVVADSLTRSMINNRLLKL